MPRCCKHLFAGFEHGINANSIAVESWCNEHHSNELSDVTNLKCPLQITSV